MSEHIEIAYERGRLTVDELQDEVARLWNELQEDEELRQEARSAGIDVDQLGASEAEPPVRVQPAAAGFEPGTILLIIAGVVARDVWKEIILPRLKRRWGADAIGPAVSDEGGAGPPA
jgi:hypothetical protein